MKIDNEIKFFCCIILENLMTNMILLRKQNILKYIMILVNHRLNSSCKKVNI